METLADTVAYDEMNHTDVNRAFVDDLLAFGPVDGEVIDLGTGTARIPMELCRRDEAIKVVATDLSVSMLDMARINIEIAALTDRILLVHADSKASEFSSNRFSVVMSNSLIHHIPEPQLALEEAVRLASNSGRIFLRDLMRPESAQAVDRLVDAHVGDESDHARQLFHDSLRAALSLDEIRQLICELGYADATVSVSSDHHWTWATRIVDG